MVGSVDSSKSKKCTFVHFSIERKLSSNRQLKTKNGNCNLTVAEVRATHKVGATTTTRDLFTNDANERLRIIDFVAVVVAFLPLKLRLSHTTDRVRKLAKPKWHFLRSHRNVFFLVSILPCHSIIRRQFFCHHVQFNYEKRE